MLSGSNDGSFESLRAANMRGSSEMLKSLNIPKLGESKVAKMPVVSSKVIRGLNRSREQPLCVVSSVSPPSVEEGSPDILTFRTPRASRVSTLRPPSRAGKWACVDGCTKKFDSVTLIVDHLRTVHKLPMLTEHLIPLGLALCAFCGNVFESFRGIIVHQKKCRGTLENYAQGVFPRKCLSWWESEKKWYEGLATPSKSFRGCFEVVFSAELYGEESMYVEPYHSLTFSSFFVQAHSKKKSWSPCPIVSGDGGVVDKSFSVSPSPCSVGNFSLTPSTPLRSSTSVLAACGIDDEPLSRDDKPLCRGPPSPSIQVLSEVKVSTMCSTQIYVQTPPPAAPKAIPVS